MVIKKTIKKRVVKMVPVKRKVAKKKPTVKKTSVKKKLTVKKPVIKKPDVKSTKAVEVIKQLEAEVRKPDLGNIKGGDKKFIPIKQPFVKKLPYVGKPGFVKKVPFVKKLPYVQRPFVKKIFPNNKPFNQGPVLKSHGERQISGFLKEEKIHFVYEYPLAITDEDRKVRIWYPDFWLPELNIIIEYMGMKGKGDYDKANFRKKKIYNALKIDFMEITPGLLVKGNWKRFIAMKIISILRSKQQQVSKMQTLASKYRVPATEKQTDLSVLDE
jgi:hypothetical protein